MWGCLGKELREVQFWGFLLQAGWVMESLLGAVLEVATGSSGRKAQFGCQRAQLWPSQWAQPHTVAVWWGRRCELRMRKSPAHSLRQGGIQRFSLGHKRHQISTKDCSPQTTGWAQSPPSPRIPTSREETSQHCSSCFLSLGDWGNVPMGKSFHSVS